MRFRGLGVVASVSLVCYACLAVAFFLVSLTGKKTGWTELLFRLILSLLVYFAARLFPGKFSDDAPSPRVTAGRVAVFVTGLLALLAGFVAVLFTRWADDHATGTILSMIACITIFSDVLEKRWLRQDARQREQESEWFRSKGIRI